MKAEHHCRDRGEEPISLNSSERIPLERTETGEDIEITVKSGVIRIAASQSKHAEDITLAFTCRSDVFKFHYPENLELSIEAITNTTYTVGSISKVESDTSDAIMDWICLLYTSDAADEE